MLTGECHIEEDWKLLKSGDQGALLALYQRHYNGLINYGFKICADKERSNDCIIKVLLKLWDARETLPEVTNVRSYLLTCLKHEIFQEQKLSIKQKTKISRFHEQCFDVQLPYEDVIIKVESNVELKKRLLLAFEYLSPREKELMQMKFYSDMDYDDIAERCHITKRTAYNIIHSALGRLKKELSKAGLSVAEFYPFIFLFLSFLLS